ncbi:MAG: hypothetical protein ABJL54_07515 [Halioglobus sp.]
MTAKNLLISFAASVAIIGGTGIEFYRGESTAPDGAAHLKVLLDPIDIATQMCGDATSDGYAQRRAPFMRLARLHAEELPAGQPPLWANLGDVEMPVTTTSVEAQVYFNQGVRLANDFNHFEAIRSFRWAQKLDPDCAMCYWAESLSLGPNINAPMDKAVVAQAVAALEKSVGLSATVSPKEKALIYALKSRYSSKDLSLRAQQDNAWAKAMNEVAQQFPQDDNIQAMAAEAMMTAQAWDYWEVDSRTPKGRTETILDILETVLTRSPDHAATIHLYIHLTEASTNPFRAEEAADRLSKLAPAAGHLVHMPSHIYHRVGRYIDSYRLNIKAVKANEAYLTDARAGTIYEYGYYTHNIHMGLLAAQYAGDAGEALRMAEKLDKKMPENMVSLAPWVQAIKVAPYFAYVQFGASERLLSLQKPGDEFPYLQAIWHYARGEALAAKGDHVAALKEAAAAEALSEHTTMIELNANGMPAPTLALIAADVVRARVDIGQGKYPEAATRLEEAAALQDSLFYSEPVFWYFPVRQMLGAALLMNGDAHRAESVFIRALVDVPNNGWALYGLREAQLAMGNDAAAKYADTLFRQAWVGDTDALSLESL